MKYFTKNDLQNGHIIEYADGDRGVIVKNCVVGSLFSNKDICCLILGKNLWDDLIYHDNNLQCEDKNKRIVAVYEANTYADILSNNPMCYRRVWCEPFKMTLEEIEEELGYSVKIIME